jgi:hypothetical protein
MSGTSIQTSRPRAQAGLFEITDDPCVTSVGKFLRKSALDELPTPQHRQRRDEHPGCCLAAC